MISPLTILILTHFISDWFFQPSRWSQQKRISFKYLVLHCIQYAILFIPVLYFLNINMLWILWIFLTHLAIDNYWFVNTWNKYIKQVNQAKKPVPDWHLVVQDQILHIIVLLPIIV